MSVQLIKRQSFHIRLRTSKAPRPDQHSHSSYTEGREWVRIADFAAFPGEVRSRGATVPFSALGGNVLSYSERAFDVGTKR